MELYSCGWDWFVVLDSQEWDTPYVHLALKALENDGSLYFPIIKTKINGVKLACRQIFSFGYQSLLPSKREVVGDWPLTHISPLGLVNSWEVPNGCVLKYAYKVKTGTTKIP